MFVAITENKSKREIIRLTYYEIENHDYLGAYEYITEILPSLYNFSKLVADARANNQRIAINEKGHMFSFSVGIQGYEDVIAIEYNGTPAFVWSEEASMSLYGHVVKSALPYYERAPHEPSNNWETWGITWTKAYGYSHVKPLLQKNRLGDKGNKWKRHWVRKYKIINKIHKPNRITRPKSIRGINSLYMKRNVYEPIHTCKEYLRLGRINYITYMG